MCLAEKIKRTERRSRTSHLILGIYWSDLRIRAQAGSHPPLDGGTALGATAPLVVAGDGTVRQSRVTFRHESGVELVPELAEDTCRGEHALWSRAQFACGVVEVNPLAELRNQPGARRRGELPLRRLNHLLDVINGVIHRFPMSGRKLRCPPDSTASYAVFRSKSSLSP